MLWYHQSKGEVPETVHYHVGHPHMIPCSLGMAKGILVTARHPQFVEKARDT